MLENMAWRWALVRLNLRPAFWWRMVVIPCEVEEWNPVRLCRLPGVESGLRMVLAGIPCRSCCGLRSVVGYCESQLSKEVASHAECYYHARCCALAVSH